ncbi:MAG: hypothetical protein HY554_01375, partial [Elusimicrobia bacterium]|nr:hypothetical protein [Elusimicrobiota bacterium]
KADLVVAISHLGTEDNARLLKRIPARIDILIGERVRERTVRRKKTVELAGWGSEPASLPALETRWPVATIGTLELEFLRGSGRPLLARIEESYATADWDSPIDQRLQDDWATLFDAYFGPKAPLLPDPRRVWHGSAVKLTYEPLEVWNIAAQALRQATGAEASLLRIRDLGSSAIGDVTETFLWEWFQPPEPILIARLPGRALRAAAARLDPQPVPVPSRESQTVVRRYGTETWFAAAGLEASGMVNSLPIRDDEWYTVATTEEVLREAGLADQPRASFRITPWPKSVGETVLEWLRERREQVSADEKRRYRRKLGRTLSRWAARGDTDSALASSFDKAFADEKEEARRAADESYRDDVRWAAEARRRPAPLWRLNLRELSVQFANTQVENRDSFTEVPDARVRAISQVLAQASAGLFSELYWGRWRWETGVSARYGRVTLKPKGIEPIENETADQWMIETEVRRALMTGRHGTLGPFANLAYDTEFTPPVDLPIRKVVRWKPGLKLFEGRLLQEAYAAAVIEEDSRPVGNTEYGFEAGLRLAVPLSRTGAVATLKSHYRRFARSPRDTADDLKSQLELDARLGLPIVGDLRLSPFVQYFRFEGKVVPETGYNVVFGVALDFSYLWKPVF